jgi:hypothetical protein
VIDYSVRLAIDWALKLLINYQYAGSTVSVGNSKYPLAAADIHRACSQNSPSGARPTVSDIFAKPAVRTTAFNVKIFNVNSTSDLSTISRLSEGNAPEHDHDTPSEACCVVHLQLLSSFVTLRGRVEKWGQSRAIDPDAAWQAFVKLAVVRFTHWFRSAKFSDIETSLPPLGELARH